MPYAFSSADNLHGVDGKPSQAHHPPSRFRTCADLATTGPVIHQISAATVPLGSLPLRFLAPCDGFQTQLRPRIKTKPQIILAPAIPSRAFPDTPHADLSACTPGYSSQVTQPISLKIRITPLGFYTSCFSRLFKDPVALGYRFPSSSPHVASHIHGPLFVPPVFTLPESTEKNYR